MPPVAVKLAHVLLISMAVLAVWAFLVVWATIIVRWRQRRPVIPYAPRRPAPWRGVDVAMVAIIFLAVQACVVYLATKFFGAEAMRTPAIYDPGHGSAQHVTLQLMSEGNVWVLLLCGFAAIVAAPVAEEFLFRVVLQGWLESLEQRRRRAMPTLRRWLPRAFLPILLTSTLFAMVHFRVDRPPIDRQILLFMMVGNAAAGLLTTVLAVVLLRWRTGAAAADFGWSAADPCLATCGWA